MTDDAAPAGSPVPDTDADPATPERASSRLELFAAIILGIAATLTAFSAYKAALLDGDALQGYTKSTRLLSDANAFYAQGNQTNALDQQLFVQWASAGKSGDEELAAYLKDDVMRPELSEAIDWLIENEDARTPFDDESPYTVADFVDAQENETQASAVFKDAAKADDNGDEFELATVLLAITLFFGGIATLFRRRPASLLLMVVAVGTLVAGGVGVATALGG